MSSKDKPEPQAMLPLDELLVGTVAYWRTRAERTQRLLVDRHKKWNAEKKARLLAERDLRAVRAELTQAQAEVARLTADLDATTITAEHASKAATAHLARIEELRATIHRMQTEERREARAARETPDEFAWHAERKLYREQIQALQQALNASNVRTQGDPLWFTRRKGPPEQSGPTGQQSASPDIDGERYRATG